MLYKAYECQQQWMQHDDWYTGLQLTGAPLHLVQQIEAVWYHTQSLLAVRNVTKNDLPVAEM